MKPLSTPLILAACLFIFPVSSGVAKPGGVYRGDAKMNVTTPDGDEGMPFPNVSLKLRLPNGTGALNGTLFTTEDARPANAKITGRITNDTVRQGGKKHILRAKWSWKMGPAGFPGTVKGTDRITVKKSGKGYKLLPKTVRVTGSGFSYKTKISGKK